MISGIRHVLLDIEGTTCPVSFVGQVLFPYAAERLEDFLTRHSEDIGIQSLMEEVRTAWRDDADAHAAGLAWDGDQSVVPYLRWLIQVDRKLTALKDLQGRIWEQGYAAGELEGPLFPDVPAALRRWTRDGVTLGVYSSGSVPAQQLLYGHSSAGDLRPLFSHWFDTRIGLKQDPGSYRAICTELQAEASKVLFISDAVAELQAAQAEGLQVLFSDRVGNPRRAAGGFERISSYSTLQISQ